MFIKYKNNDVPCQVSYGALARWQRETGIKLGEIEESIQDLELTSLLLWHSINYEYMQLSKENPYKREDMYEILQDCYLQFMEIFTAGIKKIFTPQEQPVSTPKSKKK